jgi:hypothetical protein
VVSVTPRPRFTPGEGTPVPIGQEAGWAPEPVWMQGLEKKSSTPAGDRTPIVQPVVRHYTAWATAAPIIIIIIKVAWEKWGGEGMKTEKLYKLQAARTIFTRVILALA